MSISGGTGFEKSVDDENENVKLKNILKRLKKSQNQ